MSAPTTQELDRPPEFPPGVDARLVMRPLLSPTWRLPGTAGATYRRKATQYDPLLFAITYLPHYLRDQVTGQVSFSAMHLDLARAIRQWALPDCSDRRAVIAPRDYAKTTWPFLFGLIWALAHQHRRFPLAFSHTGELAAGHLRNLTVELASNELLLQDFPHLAIAKGRGSRTGSGLVATVGSSAVGARGLGESSAGIRNRAFRPDLLIGDDLEPIKKWTGDGKRDRLHVLRNLVFPMNDRAPIWLTGTTPGYGAIMHDCVRHAAGRPITGGEWVAAERFAVHHHRPIVIDAAGHEASLWPQRHALATLQAKRAADPWGWSLNYECDPDPGADGMHGTWWTDELIRYDSQMVPDVRYVAIDVATTRNRRSDSTVLIMAGYNRARRRAVIEHAESIPGGEVLPIQERLHQLHRAHPRTLRTGVIETNQGGRLWLNNMSLPVGLTLREEHATAGKTDRIRVAHQRYAAGSVVHHRALPELEQQMRDWSPSWSGHDDLVDALAAVLGETFAGELIS